MAIDRGDHHYDDAGSWERACRHIGLFLWWAAERGLADPQHDPAAFADAPTRAFIERCDTKLWDDDLTQEGVAFARAHYGAYLAAVHDYAASNGVGDYEVSEDEATRAFFFAWLDERLSRSRADADAW